MRGPEKRMTRLIFSAWPAGNNERDSGGQLGFRFAENASVQPVVRIPDQGGAFGARYRISLLFPAVQADHVFYGSFFPIYS